MAHTIQDKKKLLNRSWKGMAGFTFPAGPSAESAKAAEELGGEVLLPVKRYRFS